MRTSAMSSVLAAALLFQCYASSMTLPMSSRTEEAALERDAFGGGDDEVAENAVGAAETALLGRNGGAAAKVIVVADASSSLWRNLWANEGGPSLNRREAPSQARFAVVRKDAMRCMVGRVYRPCWELEA